MSCATATALTPISRNHRCAGNESRNQMQVPRERYSGGSGVQPPQLKRLEGSEIWAGKRAVQYRWGSNAPLIGTAVARSFSEV